MKLLRSCYGSQIDLSSHRYVFHKTPDRSTRIEKVDHKVEAADKWSGKLTQILKTQFSPMKSQVIKFNAAMDELADAEESHGYSKTLNKKDEVIRKNKKLVRRLQKRNKKDAKKEAKQLRQEAKILDDRLDRMKDVFDPVYDDLRDRLREQKKKLNGMREKYASQDTTREELSSYNRDILGQMMALDPDKNGPAVDALLNYKDENLKKRDKTVTKEQIREQQDYVNALESTYIEFKPFYEALQSKKDKARFLGKIFRSNKPDMPLSEALSYVENYAPQIEKKQAKNEKIKKSKEAKLSIETEGDFKEVVKKQQEMIGNLETQINQIDEQIHEQEELPHQTNDVLEEITRLTQKKAEIRLKIESNQRTVKTLTSEKVKHWGTDVEKAAEDFAVKKEKALHRAEHTINELQNKINKSPDDSTLVNQLKKIEKIKFDIEAGNAIADWPGEVIFDAYNEALTKLDTQKARFEAFVGALNEQDITFDSFEPQTEFSAEEAESRIDKRRREEEEAVESHEARQLDRVAQKTVDAKAKELRASEAYGSLDRLRSELRDVNANIRALNVQINDIKRRISTRESRGDDSHTERALLAQKREELKQKYTERRQIETDIRKSDRALDKEKATILADLRHEVGEKRAAKQELQAKIEAKRLDLANASASEKPGLEAEITSLEGEFETKKAEYRKAKRIYERTRSELNRIDRSMTRWAGKIRSPRYTRGERERRGRDYYDDDDDYYEWREDGRVYGRQIRRGRRSSGRRRSTDRRYYDEGPDKRTDRLGDEKYSNGNKKFDRFEDYKTNISKERRLSLRSPKLRNLPADTRNVLKDFDHLITPVTRSENGYKFPSNELIVEIQPTWFRTGKAGEVVTYSSRFYRIDKRTGDFVWYGNKKEMNGKKYILGPRKGETFNFSRRYSPSQLASFLEHDLPSEFEHEADKADGQNYLQNLISRYGKDGSESNYTVVRSVGDYRAEVSPYNNNEAVLNDQRMYFDYNPVLRQWTLDTSGMGAVEKRIATTEIKEAMKQSGKSVDKFNLNRPIDFDVFDAVVRTWAQTERKDHVDAGNSSGSTDGRLGFWDKVGRSPVGKFFTSIGRGLVSAGKWVGSWFYSS